MDPIAHQTPRSSITRNCGNVTGSYNNVWKNCDISVADERRAVLKWLSPLEPHERHQAIGMDRIAGVGDWLLHTSEFTRWNKGDDGTSNRVLFCYGNPGVGKTYLSSLVIDRLCDQVDAGNMAVACVYCDFHAQDEQSATGLLGALLKQVVGARGSIPDEIQEAFENSKGGVGGRRLLLPDILEMLVKSLSCLRRVFICIDALDEFPAKRRPELWGCLQKIVQRCPNARLFLTGRLHIRDEVLKYFPNTADMLPISSSADDIKLYLRMRLDQDSEFDAMDKELAADILRIIPEVISGAFLLVSLNMDAILAEATIYKRRQALNRMTKGLGLQDAYGATLDRIRQQGGSKSKIGMEALMWISHSERPLRLEELYHALGVELGADDFSIQNIPSLRTLLGCALGLVTIDEWGSTPRLLHFTLQEYLGQHPTLFATAHSMMAEISLTYLNSRSVRALPLDLGDALETTPFLEYATCFWGGHASKEVTGPVKSLALQLLDGYEKHVSAAVLSRKRMSGGRFREDVRGISGLHCIAFWGIAEIAIAMLEGRIWQVNGYDSWGRTPLMWAAIYENSRMVELFLEQGDIKPDTITRDGRTAFSFAVESGDEDVVKLLLERADVNPDSSDRNGRTPLSFAAEGGHEGIMKLLLGHGDVNPDSRDSNGRTPLSFAADEGHEGVVKLLLGRGDVNPDLPDSNGRTPLSYCANALCLRPLNGGLFGSTPSSSGTLERFESVIKLFLERRDVNPDLPDGNGRTPLSFAAEEGHEGVVKLLLGHGDVDPNLPDSNGRTPLSYCANALCSRPLYGGIFSSAPPSSGTLEGLESVIKLFLERGDVNPNSPDSNGRTPLSFAAERGHESIVKLLLERGDVNPDSPDRDCRTPLSLTVSREHAGVVSLLSDPRTPKCESENHGRVPTSATDDNTSSKEATHPLMAMEPVTLPTADDPPLGAPICGSVLSMPLRERPSPIRQPSPDQSPLPLPPPVPIPASLLGSSFPFFLWPLILFIFLFFVFTICQRHGEPPELFHAIRGAWP